MKLLSLLSIPYLLPIDITIVIFYKIYEKLPDIKKELKNSLMKLISFLRSLLVKMESNRHLYSAKFSCQLAVKEFDYNDESINVRKASISSNISRKKSLQHKTSKVEKSNSFSGRKNIDRSISPQKSVDNIYAQIDAQRREAERYRKSSYAGRESHNIRQSSRRKSMIEIGNPVLPPERVISQLKFDFKMDMKDPSSQEKDDSIEDVVDSKSNQVLDIDLNEIDQTNAIEIANKALDWEKEFLVKCKKLNESDRSFDKMFEITRKQDAVMAYYYTDENNKVKFTELFNISDEDLKKLDSKNESLVTFKDSDDGLMENPIVVSKSTLSSLSTHSIQSKDVSPIKRQRKKSLMLFD